MNFKSVIRAALAAAAVSAVFSFQALADYATYSSSGDLPAGWYAGAGASRFNGGVRAEPGRKAAQQQAGQTEAFTGRISAASGLERRAGQISRRAEEETIMNRVYRAESGLRL